MTRAGLAKLTTEHRAFMRSVGAPWYGRCPHCRRWMKPLWLLRGQPLGTWTKVANGSVPNAFVDREMTLECSKCHTQWSMFDQQGNPRGAPVTAPASLIVTFEETGVTKQLYRETDRLLDNRGGSTAATQRLTISEQWTQTVQLDREHARTLGGHAGVSTPFGSAALQGEEMLRKHYEVSTSGQRTYTDELTVEVPPRTMRRLHLRYMRVFQDGVVRASSADGVALELPYRVAIALEMDWSQSDTAGDAG
jgi:hypothetical protein